jgi:alkylation response protein AidB-like acyl-CoA dehydrogenase
MEFAFTEEQNLIRETARAFCDENGTSERIRAAVATPQGYDSGVWERMTSELGWAGIAIPEVYGGSGLGMVELAILQNELGRRLIPSPFFSTVCLGAPLIALLGTEAQKADWLRRIVQGTTRATVALSGVRGTPGCEGITAELSWSGSRYHLRGESGFVIGGHASDVLLVAARAPRTRGREGVSVVLLEAGRAGVSAEAFVSLDLTRPMARLRLDVEVGVESILGGPYNAADGLEKTLQLARIALAAESVGGAEWCLEMTTAYVKQRTQFGRPVGSFQAIKHRLADMMVALEAARSASWYAACVVDDPQYSAELAEAAATAKAACSEAFLSCASNAIQLHGGIGFTWEHDAHLYFKRARAASTLLGSPAWQREQLAQILGLGEAAVIPAF